MAGVANREVSLYVITYENPYVVRAGERGQLSYVNLSTDFRRKAVSYVGSSVGLFEIFFRIFRICPWQRSTSTSSRAKHKVHTPYTTYVQSIMENAVLVHGFVCFLRLVKPCLLYGQNIK